MADVIVIQGNQAVQQEKPKLRVCAYARVSSKSDEQQYSFFGQVQHYTRLINENPEWEYMDIYADEGLTDTRKDKRDEFNRMLDDCRAGKIDKILTKAVSRLARNISECVEVVKKLKELGVTVYFEEQQLDSGRPSDFTAICVYAAIAQEESISVAQNMRMSCSARMKLGTYKQVNAPYGYYIENDEFKINEEQAQVVRVIFRAYIEGKSIYKIADELNQAGVPTKFGGVTWRIKDISYILSNVRSGNCSQDCAYCAQSCRSNADIDTYKWVEDEKLYNDNDFVNEHHLSRHCIGLSGMGFTDAEIEQLAGRIRKMKETGTHLCCSIGFLTEKQAKMLKDAGLDRINHNLNSSRNYYSHICTTHTFDQRVENIHMLQRLGFEICSGGIIGMGESKEDVVDMLMELKEINPEALPINFLLPIPGTPLGDQDISGLTYEYGIKVLCLARLLVPQSDIRCAAGREVYFKGHEKVMLSVVDSIFASGYLTAGGQGIKDTIQTITDAGFTYEIESA